MELKMAKIDDVRLRHSLVLDRNVLFRRLTVVSREL